MIDNGITLELIRRDPNPEFLIKGGVKRVAALYIIDDINKWVEVCKRARTEE
jgi:hypothetical protein